MFPSVRDFTENVIPRELTCERIEDNVFVAIIAEIERVTKIYQELKAIHRPLY